MVHICIVSCLTLRLGEWRELGKCPQELIPRYKLELRDSCNQEMNKALQRLEDCCSNFRPLCKMRLICVTIFEMEGESTSVFYLCPLYELEVGSCRDDCH